MKELTSVETIVIASGKNGNATARSSKGGKLERVFGRNAGPSMITRYKNQGFQQVGETTEAGRKKSGYRTTMRKTITQFAV